MVIDMATRDFVKEINQKQGTDEWTKQRRIQKTFKKQIQNPESYNWKSFWENTSAKGTTTSFKENNRKSFLLKLIHDELPTLNK
jgi:hypothetical protein